MSSLQAGDGTPLATTTVEQADTPSIVIAEMVSDLADAPLDELPPLANAVDPDALDAVFAGEDTVGRLTFTFADYDVLLDSAGAVAVYRSGSITT